MKNKIFKFAVSLLIMVLAGMFALRAEAALDWWKFLDLCKTGTAQEVEVAIKEGSDPNTEDVGGQGTALMYAAANNNNPDVITTLVKNGADVNTNAKNSKGYTALVYAVEYNKNPDVITALIEAGADVNAKTKDSDGKTILTIAAQRENLDVISELIRAGAEPDVKDLRRGQTALMYAVRYYYNNPDAVIALIEASVDINAQNVEGKTALMYAVDYNFEPDLITALIEAGADANIKTNGMTALDILKGTSKKTKEARIIF